MAAAPPGRELCPYCRRPFKRLRTHLPHCKAAPSPAPGSAPGSGLGLGPAASSAPGLGPGPAAGTPAPGSGFDSNGAGPAAGPGAASRPRTGAADKSSKRPPSPGVGQGLPDAAPREAAAGRAETAAAARKGKKAAAEQDGGSGPGLCSQPDGRHAERKVEPTVQDVAKSLDLLPEEVKDIPEKLSNGVKIVIEKHRARVIREKSGSRSRGISAGSHITHRSPVEGPDPGGAADHTDAAQPEPQEVPETANTETCGLGAAENASASLKGKKGSSLKGTKIPVLRDPPEAGCRSSPGDLVQREGVDKTVTEEKQMYLEAGVKYKAPLSALHTKNHLSAIEGFTGHNEGTSKNYLTSIQKLRESKEQMAVVSEPILNARRDTELALHQFLLHTSKSQPICLSQASGRSTPAGAMGLEWFPDLYPNYDGLSIFPGKPFQEGVGITTKTPKGSVSEGQQGPLSERRLMDVRLGELPAWLATCKLSPQGLLGGVRKAWSSYYDKYINVKRGGPAGISMLLAGYCLLSYGWNYQHIKCHRWRKYH
ncbi:mitochondrial nucleoid-associated protein 1 [Calonectris borealis]|uniref:mitochondrial nucleoid-associated protein 1 n=1 Tax=Calonectris borealis TaxID=1323832 RepID=UPI003F4B5907